MDYYCVFAWRKVEGARFSGLAAWCVSPAPVCKDSAGELLSVPSPPFPLPVNAFCKEDVCDEEDCRASRERSWDGSR